MIEQHRKNHGEIFNHTVQVLTSRNREGYTFVTIDFLAVDENGDSVEVSYRLHAKNDPGDNSMTVELYDYQTNRTDTRVVEGVTLPDDED